MNIVVCGPARHALTKWMPAGFHYHECLSPFDADRGDWVIIVFKSIIIMTIRSPENFEAIAAGCFEGVVKVENTPAVIHAIIDELEHRIDVPELAKEKKSRTQTQQLQPIAQIAQIAREVESIRKEIEILKMNPRLSKNGSLPHSQ